MVDILLSSVSNESLIRVTSEEHTDLYNINKFVELLDHLLEYFLRSGHNNREQGLVLVQPDGQRLDVVPSPSEDASDSIDHPALVPNKH